MGRVRQQGRGEKAACRARSSAGLSVRTDPVDRHVRRGTALSAASGCDHGLVMVAGRGWHETLRLGEVATACAIRAVRGLGLRIFPAKPEAIQFYDKNRRETPPSGLSISMEGKAVGVRSQMKYLGLIIDSQWTFGPHFDSLVPKISVAANVLCGLLRNIDGAGVAVRRLYEGVIRSGVMYRAPIWAYDLMVSRRSILFLRRLHRVTAIRIISGYRTVSHASATVLAASPPWELGALALKQRYTYLRALNPGEDAAGQAAVDDVGPVAVSADQRRRRTSRRGGGPPKLEDMEEPPRFPAHLQDDPGAHGTWRVRRVPDEDWTRGNGHLLQLQGGQGHSAAHAGILSGMGAAPSLGRDLASSVIVETMLGGPHEYEAVRSFCEQVMLVKERAEREREKNSHPCRVTRWRVN